MFWHSNNRVTRVTARTKALAGRYTSSSPCSAAQVLRRKSTLAHANMAIPSETKNYFKQSLIDSCRVAAPAAEYCKFMMRQDFSFIWLTQYANSLVTNPSTHTESLHVASHAFVLDGYTREDDRMTLDDILRPVRKIWMSVRYAARRVWNDLDAACSSAAKQF